jgi:hypothetical protein
MPEHDSSTHTIDLRSQRYAHIDLDTTPPLAVLLRNSGKERKEIARDMGFQNLGQGMNLLWSIEWDLALVPELRIPALATALNVPLEVIRQANADTITLAQAKDDFARRRAFRPNIVWIPVRKRVTPMFIGMMLLQPVVLPEGLDEAQRVQHALRVCPGSLPMWGDVSGFWINHTPDRAVAHDLSGAVVAERQSMVERLAWVALR